MFRHAQSRDRRAPAATRHAARCLSIAVLVFSGTVVAPSASAAGACGPNEVLIGWFGDGVTCLDASGWTTFNRANAPVSVGMIHDLAICPDGSAWIADSRALVSVRDGTWTNHERAFASRSPEFVRCAAGGGVWVGGYDLLGSFDGQTFRAIDIANLGSAKFANMIKAMAVAPNGDLWVASSTSLARQAQGRWTVWSNGQGYSSKYDYYFDALVVDRMGVPYAAASSALLRLAGGKWTDITPKGMTQPKAMAVDAKNRLWVGTYSKGLWMLDGRKWRQYTVANKLASNSITALAVDASGRLWVGTDWGISVQAGSGWTTYRMENALMPANDVHGIAVSGRGPSLPAKVTKAMGTFTGRLVRNGAPQSGLLVEVCSEFIGGLFTGSSPCADQVFHRQTRTGGDGRFTFTLPNGKYGLVYRGTDGKWVRLTDGYRIGSREMLVPAGGNFDVGDLELSKAK